MSLFDSILVPVFNPSAFRPRDFTLTNAFIVSSWLKVKLNFITPTIYTPRLKRRLHQFKKFNYPFYIYESSGDFSQDIVNTIYQDNISLLVLGTDPTSFSGIDYRRTWEQDVLQGVNVPILICPMTTHLTQAPFASMLVPISGENRLNAALELALHVSSELKMPIDLIHVTLGYDISRDPSLVGHLSDHFYHEYPRLVDRLISEGSPFSSLRERLLIREFWHCQGDQTNQILKRIETRNKGLLVIEWQGKLIKDHAVTLKTILAQNSYPVLLIRKTAHSMSVLKVGKNFKERDVSAYLRTAA